MPIMPFIAVPSRQQQVHKKLWRNIVTYKLCLRTVHQTNRGKDVEGNCDLQVVFVHKPSHAGNCKTIFGINTVAAYSKPKKS